MAGFDERGTGRVGIVAGIVVLLFYVVHNGHHVIEGRLGDTLWACNVAPLLIGIGLLARTSRVAGIGLLWLTLGVPLWLLDLATGGALAPTAILTHVGGLAAGLLAARTLGLPRGTWLVAFVSLVLLHIVSRYVTPPHLNVNLAHVVWSGWETRFPSYAVYQLLLFATAATTFAVFEGVFRRSIARRDCGPSQPSPRA